MFRRRARRGSATNRGRRAMIAGDETSVLERLGGEEAVQRCVTAFYDAIARDPLLAPLFSSDLTLRREQQFAFFVQFLGGPARYSEAFGRPFLRYLHRKVRNGQEERDAWMRLLLQSLREVT